MTLATERKRIGRKPLTIVEFDLDYCTLTYGVLPCTASGATRSECFNTRKTCQDVANYDPGIKTYRFCDPVADLPVDLGAIPCLKSISAAPTRITPGKGLGYRAAVTIEMSDLPHHDRGIDKYASTRPYTPEAQGTFFGKLMTRNPYYKGRSLRVMSGYLTEAGVYDPANFDTREYIIESMAFDYDKGRFTIKAMDVLSKTDTDKAQCPEVSTGTLSVALTSSATSLTLQTGESDDYRLDQNLLKYSEQIDNSAWVKSDISVSANTDADQYGDRTLDEIDDGTALATHYIYILATISAGYCVYRCIGKLKAGTKYLQMRPYGIGSGKAFASFDLANGTVAGSGGTELISAKIQDMGGSLFRCTMVANHASAPTGYLVGLSDDTELASYTGANNRIAIGKCQMENNKEAGRYVSTTTAAASLTNAVRIGSEIIEYTGRSGDTLTGLTRGAWGSTAAAHSIGDAVQQCQIYSSVNCVTAAIDLCDRFAGISPAMLDLTAWYLEKVGNLSLFNVKAILTKPEGVKRLLGELAEQSLFNLWWDERTQKVRLKSIAPYTTDTPLNDDDNMISITVTDKQDERISRMIVFYDLVDRVNPDKDESYNSIYVHADLETELSTKYGEKKIKVVRSRWYDSSGPVIKFASRMVAWLKETPKHAKIKVDAKDGALWISDPIDVESDSIQGADGARIKTEMMILEANEDADGNFQYLVMDSPFFGRYAVVMDDGTLDYNGEDIGGYIAPDSLGFKDGGEAFKIA